jgi:hypothetical protein
MWGRGNPAPHTGHLTSGGRIGFLTMSFLHAGHTCTFMIVAPKSGRRLRKREQSVRRRIDGAGVVLRQGELAGRKCYVADQEPAGRSCV